MTLSHPSKRAARVAAAVALALLLTGQPTAAKEQLPEVTHDGLHLVPDSEVAAAWVKPDADFGGYRRVMILEVHVAFRKNWQRDQSRGSVHRITNRDVERIKQAMAELFREVFVEELGRDDGYPVVEQADDDVLLLRPAIIDLDITAPDLPRAGRSRTFASSAGAATLFLELYDSVSGEILARAIDRQVAGDTTVMRYTNQVTNRAEAKRVLAGWARLLRDRLDAVRGEGGSEDRGQ